MRELNIAYGNNCQAKIWINKTITFDALKGRLANTIRTSESAEEYASWKKEDRDMAKDHGGFVAGLLREGRRLIQNVQSRSMVTLDGDRVTPEFVAKYKDNMPYASVLYSTHSSTPENPRVRIIVPLTRDVSAEEFVALARYLAKDLGIDFFDECSYLANQLMYWPSTPSNGEYIYKSTDGAWMDPDEVLSRHPEWQDPFMLPTSSRESRANSVNRKKAEDPLVKRGIIGAFNRAYFPINDAIDAFLKDVYEPAGDGNRYRYKPSVSMAGVEVKDDGRYVYSHHATDPASMRLCNAYDIVRLHLFGDGSDSDREMRSLAVSDERVKKQLLREKTESAHEDFAEDPDGDAWKEKLTYNNRTLEIENTLHNITLILENDRNLQGIVFNQLADGMEIKGTVPWKHPAKFWRDADDAQLISYIDSHYGSFSQRNYDIAVTKVADDRSYHPIREMFASLPPWDGIPRVDTLYIDYLGALDTPYVRAVTRKGLCAAYMRVHHPGIKFDYVTVFNGRQGIGKSTLIAALGMEWFSDSLALSDMSDKTAAEKLQGFWIHEISEMAGMRKADLEKVKAFASRQDDKYRASFGRRVTPHPRQCVFFGTTNSENGYLRDITGNRRFWNVKVSGNGKHKPWELDADTVRQVWAEVMELAEAGEKLYLPHDLEAYAQAEQRDAMEQDDREGLVRQYLDILLPNGWRDMDIYGRKNYISDPDDMTAEKGTNRRETVSNIEIWCECFGKPKADLKPSDSYAISAIMARIEGWERTPCTMRDRFYGKQRVYKRRS